MDSFVKSDKTATNKIDVILPSEAEFKLTLKTRLGSNYKMIKSRWVYSPIDFLIFNKDNLKCLYTEHKRRNERHNNKYKSIIVNHSKIVNCKQNYPNTLFVFEYDDVYKYIKYCRDFDKFDGGCVLKQDVVFIPNDKIISGSIEDLSKYIKKIIG